MSTESPHWQSGHRHGPPAGATHSELTGQEREQRTTLDHPRRRPVNATLEKAISPRSLGWLSVGLGAAALLAPGPLARLTGLGAQSALLPVVGLRELASGFGLLKQQDGPWLWARVAGDVMDLAVIASALKPSNPQRMRALGTAGVVAAIAAVDLTAAIAPSVRRRRAMTAGPFSAGLLVHKSPQECYEFWRDSGNLPKFSEVLDSVRRVDERHERWTLRGPRSSRLSLIVKSTADESAKRIAWHSAQGSDLSHAGVVRFDAAPGNRGTLVTASLWYRPLGGKAGVRVGKLVGADPRSRLRQDLRRFKQLIETGEVATTRGQPSGRRSLFGRWIPEGRRSRRKDPT